ncbi:hypothetical protein V8F33_009593 [Rhypophila sp. PSN 637]
MIMVLFSDGLGIFYGLYSLFAISLPPLLGDEKMAEAAVIEQAKSYWSLSWPSRMLARRQDCIFISRGYGSFLSFHFSLPFFFGGWVLHTRPNRILFGGARAWY